MPKPSNAHHPPPPRYPQRHPPPPQHPPPPHYPQHHPLPPQKPSPPPHHPQRHPPPAQHPPPPHYPQHHPLPPQKPSPPPHHPQRHPPPPQQPPPPHYPQRHPPLPQKPPPPHYPQSHLPPPQQPLPPHYPQRHPPPPQPSPPPPHYPQQIPPPLDRPSKPHKPRQTTLASCIVATVFLIFIIILIFIIYFSLFKPKDPRITITAVQIPTFTVSTNSTTISFTFSQYAFVHNPNRAVFSHFDSNLQLLYAGNQVGFMFIPAGNISAGRTGYMSATFSVQSFPIMASQIEGDVPAMVLPPVTDGFGRIQPTIELESRTEMVGRVKVLRLFTHHVEAVADCRVIVAINDGSVLDFHC